MQRFFLDSVSSSMKNIVLFILLALGGVLQAQNFQPWYVDSEIIYSGDIQIGLKTERYNTDSTVLYLNKTLNGYSDCLVYGTSILGDSIVVNSMESRFYNDSGNVFILKHDLVLGDEWQFSDSLSARVCDMLTKDVLGEELLVAEICLSYNDGSELLAGMIDKIEVAEGIGLVSLYDFNNPFLKYSEIYYGNIQGVTLANAGIVPLDFKQLFSMPVGTFIHERGYDGGMNRHPYYFKDYVEINILDKVFYDDSVNFKIAINHIDVEYNSEENDSIVVETLDTLDVWKFKKDYVLFPGEFVPGVYNEVDNVLYNRWSTHEYSEIAYEYIDGCLTEIIFGQGLNDFRVENVIGDGLFRTYYSWSVAVDQRSYLPVYYNTGVREWGTPLDVLTGVKENVNQKFAKIYPTVINEEFTIEVEVPSEVHLYSKDGVLQARMTIQSSSTIPVNEEWKGMMFYSIVSQTGDMQAGKLFVE